jgi:t-SNARE complex subunit (syntaxin)
MNDARIKTLERQRYSEVSERQRERNKERVEHASSILAELEKQVGDDNGRLETAKELVSLAGTETRTKGCNNILTDSLKLLRESAENAGLAEYYREQMREMPDETVSEPPSVERYCFTDREEERRRREPVRTESDYKENLTNRGE